MPFITEHHAMKVYWGSGGVATRINNGHQMEVSGKLHAPTALPPRKEPLLPIG
jgi:hypothetical protein